MSIKVSPITTGGHRVSIRIRLPSGEIVRERYRHRDLGKAAAERWANERVVQLLKHGKEPRQTEVKAAPKEIPTFAVFAEEFLQTYATTNNKASELDSKRRILENHLKPALGTKRLDEIGPREIEAFKAAQVKAELEPKTINNQLTVLLKILNTAVKWRSSTGLAIAPDIEWMDVPDQEFDFLKFEEADRLLEKVDSWWKTMTLVALRTGLRIGELRALRWEDVDLVAGRIMVRQAAWKKKIGTPKGGKSREIPLSPDALEALKGHRHLRGEYVFCHEAGDGELLTEGEVKWPLWRACKRASLRMIQWHVLRHTFASHLVMRGVPLKAVQELMGHATIEMTMRYAHLAPEVRSEAVAMLDDAAPGIATRGTNRAQAKIGG